jgi:23S rRNA (uridine2552-2'-O)-methyltransferase
MNDPYVHMAQEKGYRCRSAFKIQEIDEKFQILKRGSRVLDLGCAPGGWCQWILPRIGPQGFLMGIDLLATKPLPGLHFICGDITDPEIQAMMVKKMTHDQNSTEQCALFDVIFSDIAPSLTGHAPTDRLQMDALLTMVWEVAQRWLAPGGSLVVKVYHGDMMAVVGGQFSVKKYMKPKSSRPESREIYMVAKGFKGARS